MTTRPQVAKYRPETPILELGESFYDPVEAARFPETRLRFRNDRAAGEVGLAQLDDAQWIAHFGRFEPLPDNLAPPLALRYHGHQFRVYNPEIGDGRGFLFAQMRDGADRLMDLGTKGSGQTPWSRFGDGRLTLKGGVREILATEMLEALGVETSRTFSLIETGEALERGDEPSPTRSSALVRLSHGHIRIGTFQRLAFIRDEDGMRSLIAYALKHYFGEEAGDDAPARLLAHVVRRTARLAPSYIAAGFVHGVLNSDNINITGESFDYGPWRFTPFFDPGFTAAYFDQTGLYAFGRQAEAIHWNVVQLAVALRLVAEAEELVPAIEPFAQGYEDGLIDRFLWRLGVKPRGPEHDKPLVGAIERALMEGTVEIDRFFFDWAGGRKRGATPADMYYAGPAFEEFREAVAGYEPARALEHRYWSDKAPCSMHIDEVEAIWARIAEHDDWTALEAKVAAVRRMGEAMMG
ncbi:protein adenylyltransferase SelO family protein [Sphingomonas sp. LaA6.9]|uniref:protein adenylyltransferase SelO family protein n=1 Tax=Sphingomonas sp. LaA6.9 TaxID=2919914 RepID=UPI001F50339A|nr:YdiU family protein [Sphingomonas sp. LaA6.9]MCJ8155994.1 YdiU family protein [Sphingomonas sp. LaA6.9]